MNGAKYNVMSYLGYSREFWPFDPYRGMISDFLDKESLIHFIMVSLEKMRITIGHFRFPKLAMENF